MTAPMPNVDTAAAATEFKKFLDSQKSNLVDWGYWNIECYPSPEDDEYPTLKAFAKQWEELFDYAEVTTSDEDGTGFPEEAAKMFDEELKKIEDAVNNDEQYWQKIRDEIIPLYQPPPGANLDEKPELKQLLQKWQERWQRVELGYDPMGFDVTTTQMWTNKKTGERRRGKILNQRTMPPGFIVKVR